MGVVEVDVKVAYENDVWGVGVVVINEFFKFFQEKRERKFVLGIRRGPVYLTGGVSVRWGQCTSLEGFKFIVDGDVYLPGGVPVRWGQCTSLEGFQFIVDGDSVPPWRGSN
ncbi:hypothetical protein ACOMHN_048470 [Nucella lapillus]